jgi:uncharacterized protein (TIGR03790 family)
LITLRAILLCSIASGAAASPPSADEVVVIVNRSSTISVAIGEYYRAARGVPSANVCEIAIRAQDPALADTRLERVTPKQYQSLVREPVARCLEESGLAERALVLVTTKGVPLLIVGEKVAPRDLLRAGTSAAVDAELALLFSDGEGRAGIEQSVNPYFGVTEPFRSWGGRGQPLRYLVTRLTGYQDPVDPETGIPADVRALIDRSNAPTPPGTFVVDEDPALAPGLDAGNRLLLRPAADALRALGVGLHHETTPAMVSGVASIAGFATWGSNATAARTSVPAPFYGSIGGRLHPGRFLPRAVTVSLVSGGARSFVHPPRYRQSMAADLVRLGAAGVAGHVREPSLAAVTRPHLLLREYAQGASAAEAFYRSVPYLGWTNVYVGDPLMTTAHPVRERPCDSDADGRPDDADNCREISNPKQRDADGDGFGNVCDADVDGDGLVTTSWGDATHPGDVERIALASLSGSRDPALDLDGDGRVSQLDVSMAHLLLFRPPGPGPLSAQRACR